MKSKRYKYKSQKITSNKLFLKGTLSSGHDRKQLSELTVITMTEWSYHVYI